MRDTDPDTSSPAVLGFGLDAGGTQTRWALAGADSALVAEGSVDAVSGAVLAGPDGAAQADALAAAIGATVMACGASAPQAAVAGVTGIGLPQQRRLRASLARVFGIAETAVRVLTDIELACLAAPPDATVLYAGTGSIAARLLPDGSLQRAGGRGPLIDDAGGGHWIAARALRRVWRVEDEAPGAWRRSPLARALFDRIGGSDWSDTRAWLQGADRGDVGILALAVAAAAEAGDADALALLQAAGAELARLAWALQRQSGQTPALLVLAGRVFDLHPAVEQALAAALPAGTTLQRLQEPPHHAAARLAAQAAAAATSEEPR